MSSFHYWNTANVVKGDVIYQRDEGSFRSKEVKVRLSDSIKSGVDAYAELC